MPDLNHDSNPTEALTLDYGWKWGKTEIVFDWAHVAPSGTSFEAGTFEDVSLDAGDPNAGPNEQRYSVIRQSVREALDLIEQYTGLTFMHTSEIPGGATPDITFGVNNYIDPTDGSRPPGYAFVPLSGTSPPTLAPVWLAQTFIGQQVNWDKGDVFHTILHEIGHALGLGHADTDASHGSEEPLPDGAQSYQFSTMSYNNAPGMAHWNSQTMMLYDIWALQQMYGKGQGHSGTDIYTIDGLTAINPHRSSNFIFQTIWDSGGTDTIDFYDAPSGVIVDLRPGEFSSVATGDAIDNPINNLAIAFDSWIEHARGGASDDILIGNKLDNALEGGDGSDWLFGDGMVIGDALASDFADDFKTLWRGVPGTLTQQLIEAGPGYGETAGDSGNDTLVGGVGFDWLWGGAGDDVLDAAAPGDQDPEGENGWDRLVGGAGSDTFLCSGYDLVLDPDPQDKLFLGGKLLTGGTWQYVEELETDMWIGAYGEVYSADLIDGVYYLYGVDFYDFSSGTWNSIDGVGILNWEDGDLGIHLTGGPDQLLGSPPDAVSYRFNGRQHEDATAFSDDAPGAFRTISYEDVLDASNTHYASGDTGRWASLPADAVPRAAAAIIPICNTAPILEDQTAHVAA